MTARRYYKATRLDGTSFWDGATRWAVGETVTIPADQRRTELCGPGILHVADTPSETMVGGSWPCRLFRVEPAEIVASKGHKHGAHAVAVMDELPAWQVFGPHGEAVAQIIERASQLTADEASQLVAAWYIAGAAAGAAAWDNARDNARANALDNARYAAVYIAGAAAGDTAWKAIGDAAGAAAAVAAWDAAGAAAWDAAWVAATWDLANPGGPYTPAHRDLLMQPWREVIGLPASLEEVTT